MDWLDSGNARSCNSTVGDPTTIFADYPNAAITWSNIKWGELGSTGSAPGPGPGSSSSSTTASTTSIVTSTATSSGVAQAEWGQFRGNDWTGPTVCIPVSLRVLESVLFPAPVD
jgi:hypothetical protein